jgi:hypothetical protein
MMPKSRDLVKSEILLELGNGSIDIEATLEGTPSRPENHLDYAINHTLQMFYEYNIGESLTQDWIFVNLQPGKQIYRMPDEVALITNTSVSNGMGGMSPFYMFNTNTYESVMSMTINFQEWDFIGYRTSMMLIEEINKALGIKFYSMVITNADGTRDLKITPPPPLKQDYMMGGIAECYKFSAPEAVYGHRLFVQVAAGKLGMIWAGVILGKWGGTTPGGQQLNSSGLYTHFKDMYDKNLELLKKESYMPEIFAY